jgi:Protein kinase domain
MVDLLEAVRHHCGDLEPAVVERHFRRLPPAYFERYSAADIARHLRLLAGMKGEPPVDVEIRPLALHTFEVLVVGQDHAGTLACITAALAALGYNLEDVQVTTYLATETTPGESEPNFFVILLRITGNPHGQSLAELASELRGRLQVAFAYLFRGELLEAQTAASDTSIIPLDATQQTPAPSGRLSPPEYEGMMLGGDFCLQRKLAVGGMSEVYLATQTSLNRTVAVKLIRHEGSVEDDLMARFCQEGLVLAQFNCPYIVQIFAAGTIPGKISGVIGWMAMEYMAGGDLARWQRQHGGAPIELAARWFRETLEGLHYAHRHNVLHRDLKPHNLLLTAEGHLKVSDFGLLKQAREPEADLTPRSAIIGTPHYMAPEQALGETIDERSDIFSLGTTFYHLLSGQLPFNKNTTAAILVQIAQEDAPRLSDVSPQLPAPLVTIIARMMARQKEERYQDVGVILEDLASYERRGLLNCSESPTFLPVQPSGDWGGIIGETQDYRQSPGKSGDKVN